MVWKVKEKSAFYKRGHEKSGKKIPVENEVSRTTFCFQKKELLGVSFFMSVCHACFNQFDRRS